MARENVSAVQGAPSTLSLWRGTQSRASGRIRVEPARLAFCAIPIAIGCLVVAGWIFGVESLKIVLSGYTTMKLNTALGLVAGGLAPLCIGSSWSTGARRGAAGTCAGLLLVLGLATLCEYQYGLNLGIDELLIADPGTTSMPFPGRMSPATAIAFAAMGASILALTFGETRAILRLGHLVAEVPLGIAYLTVVGYAYHVDGLYDFGPYVAVALHTALGIGFAGCALLLTRMEQGWGANFRDRPIAARVLFRLLILAVAVPFLTGEAIVLGARHHLYQPMFGPALFALFAAAAYVALATHASLMVRAAEDEMVSSRREVESANAALTVSEAQFRTFAQAMPNHVWAAHGNGLLYWFNDRTYSYSGATQGDLDGTAWASIIHPDDAAASGKLWQAALDRGTIYEAEFRIKSADQSYRWFLVRAEPIREHADEVTRWIGTNTDIHDRKLATSRIAELNETLEMRVEERTRDLRQSEAKASTYFNTSPDYLLLLRADGDGHMIVDDINPAAERVFQKHRAEVSGSPPARILPVEAARDIERHAADCLRTGENQIYQVRRSYLEGQDVLIDATVTLVERGEDGGGVILFCGRDITEQRRTEEALRQAQKMEAVGQLTGGIAHDFNNMLAGISGSLELMETRLSQGRHADLGRYIGVAQGAAKRAAALTHRLLAFSRRQTLDPRAIDVNRIVADMEDLVRRTVGPAIKLERVAAGGLWTTFVDPGQLENALLNLCINARDAMPDGGHLIIETGNRWLDDRGARERDLAPGQYVSLCVSDNGTGMAADVIERAFEPFFTTKPIGQGTGLGLSMIYGFAKQSGGQCRIYSELGQGTMICLYLPRHGGVAEAVAAHATQGPVPLAAVGETVLVVDDEPTVRMLVSDVLEELGYAALEAADGAAGLTVLQSNVRIDLLVTDVGLPGMMNGRQMADAARRTRPDLKVLFITGYAENAVLGHGHLDPGMHVLTKPFAMDLLGRRIKDLIEAAASH